ncbi:MAG: PD40 domain-containing protein [Anaerolineae bacterium]|nr:PD40 domain-containing protein [Anaerolineae bacterium]
MKRYCFVVFIIILFTSGMTVSTASDASLKIEWKQISSDLTGNFTWSPDSQYIAFTDIEIHNLYILNVQTQIIERQFVLPAHSDNDYPNDNLPNALSWSPDGLYIAITINGIAYVLDAQSGQEVQNFSEKNESNPHDQTIVDVRWGQDLSSLASFSYLGLIHIFDSVTGKTLKSISVFSPSSYKFYPYKFDWSPDNTLFAAPFSTIEQDTVTPDEYRIDITTTIGIWDKDGNRVDNNACQVVGDFREILGLKWSTDSKKLAIGTSEGLAVCSLTKNFAIQKQSISDNTAHSPVWSVDAHWLITSYGTDPLNCQVNIYDASKNYKLSQTIQDVICKVDSLAWSPNGKQIAVINDGHLWIGTITIP